MQYSRRKEPFRYVFDEPVSAEFKISKVNDNIVMSRSGDIKIVDISFSGMKIVTPLNIQVIGNKIEAGLRFHLNMTPFEVKGILLWQQSDIGRFFYGMKLFDDSYFKNQLMNELKTYSRIRKNMGNRVQSVR